MTDKLETDEWSLAKAYHLSTADKDILKLCQRIMIGRSEVAWIGEREETYSGEERVKLMEQRVEVYDRIEKDMGDLEGYMPESLYAARRMLEIVLDVLGHRLISRDSWLGGSAIERLLVAVSERVTRAAEDEAWHKWHELRSLPVKGKAA